MASGSIAVSQGDFDPALRQIGDGMFLTSAGLLAIVDIPLSLVGDTLTLPIACARSKQRPWATWWGEQSLRSPATPLAPVANADYKQSQTSIEPSH
jgi:hypothetical protein